MAVKQTTQGINPLDAGIGLIPKSNKE